MAGRRPNQSNTVERVRYYLPRGSVWHQLLQQPLPERHDFSYNLAGDHVLNRIQLPDLALHRDVLELFLTTPHASRIQPPYAFRPSDFHGWDILYDSTLLPCIDSNGEVTDGEHRILGHIISAPASREAPPYLQLALAQLSLTDFSLHSQADSFVTNPWSPTYQDPPDLATPGSSSANDNRAETVVTPNSTDTNLSTVYDKNFDVGVSPL